MELQIPGSSSFFQFIQKASDCRQAIIPSPPATNRPLALNLSVSRFLTFLPSLLSPSFSSANVGRAHQFFPRSHVTIHSSHVKNFLFVQRTFQTCNKISAYLFATRNPLSQRKSLSPFSFLSFFLQSSFASSSFTRSLKHQPARGRVKMP